jgi:hypothetical protein
VRGAWQVAQQFAGRTQAAQLALINGAAGLVWAPGSRPRVVFSFTCQPGKSMAIEMLADPAPGLARRGGDLGGRRQSEARPPCHACGAPSMAIGAANVTLRNLLRQAAQAPTRAYGPADIVCLPFSMIELQYQRIGDATVDTA